MKLALVPVVLCALCCACSSAQIAAEQKFDQAVMPTTSFVCSELEAQPALQPWVDFACIGVEAAEQYVASLDAGAPVAAPDASSSPMVVSSVRTFIVRVPREGADAFRAAYCPGAQVVGAPLDASPSKGDGP